MLILTITVMISKLSGLNILESKEPTVVSCLNYIVYSHDVIFQLNQRDILIAEVDDHFFKDYFLRSVYSVVRIKDLLKKT